MALAAGLAREWERAYPKAFPQRNDSNARKMKTMRGKVTSLWQHFVCEGSRKNAAGFDAEKLRGLKFSNRLAWSSLLVGAWVYFLTFLELASMS